MQHPRPAGLELFARRWNNRTRLLFPSPQAGFVEFMRGRYYVVVTTVPVTQGALGYIHTLARRLDSRILHYGPSA